jgi:streptogramin lyase
MRTFSALVLSALCIVPAARVHASTLDEWILPAGVRELDVDASLGPATGPIAFVQGLTGVVDTFAPATSTLTHWTVGPAVLQFTVAGQIQMHDDAALHRFVFVTDATHSRIGRLDITGGLYAFWNITIAPARKPHALAVDHPTGQVWFTTYDGIAPPAVAVLSPATGTIRSWTLPAAIATPAHQLDGIVVTRASGTLLVYVAIPQRNELLEINPAALTARTWPLRYTRPTRIAVNSAGEIFAPNATTNLMFRFIPSLNQETLWFDGTFAFAPYISIDSASTPFLPSTNPLPFITNLNPIGGMVTGVLPTPFVPAFVPIAVPTNVVPASPSTVVLPMIPPPIVGIGPAPFVNWQVPGNGPLSCDATAALRDTWFVDNTTNRIARLRP